MHTLQNLKNIYRKNNVDRNDCFPKKRSDKQLFLSRRTSSRNCNSCLAPSLRAQQQIQHLLKNTHFSVSIVFYCWVSFIRYNRI